MYPHAGGQYVFLREAYGDFWAFLFGWTQFLVIQNGFNAAVAIAFAKYLGVLVPSLGEANVLARIPLGELLPAGRPGPRAPLPAPLRTQLGPIGGLRGDRPADRREHPRCPGRGLRAEPVHGAEGGRAGGADRGRAEPQRRQHRSFLPADPARCPAQGPPGGFPGRAGRRPVEGPVRLRRLVHGHLRRRGGPRLPSHAAPGAGAGLPAGDGPVRADERRLPVRPARRPDRRGAGEPGGGAGGRGALRQRRLDADDRRHPGLDLRLPQRDDPRRGPGVLRHGPRGALLPQLRPAAHAEDAR